MIVTRINADEHGGFHFAVAEIPLAPATLFPQLPPFRTTRFNSSNPIKLFAVSAELAVFEWHIAPERQLAVAKRVVEYETIDGEVRRFGPGEIVFVEDTTGRGHAIRFANGEQCFLHIPVPDDRPAAGAHVSQ